MWIRTVLCLVLVLNASGAFAEGKACGNSYISKDKTCHKFTPHEHGHEKGRAGYSSEGDSPEIPSAPYPALAGLLAYWRHIRNRLKK